MNVSVFGLGYVGSVTAACLAQRGHRVIGVDRSTEKVEAIRAGHAPLVETGLEALISAMVSAGRLTATRDAGEAIRASDLALICVGTPGSERGQPELDALSRVARDIGRELEGRQTPFTVVVRSTVLPGTTDTLFAPALRHAAEKFTAPLHVAVNPEFMREGVALRDFEDPPLVLIGSDQAAVADEVEALYAGLNAQVVRASVRTAEMVKFVCNAFHGLKIAFANEVGDVCDALGADACEVMRIVTLDRKLNISPAYLRPGFAFGGSCLPKDLRALLWAGRESGTDVPLLSSILPSNDRQVAAAVRRLVALGCRRIGVVGLAFKNGTDDLRESPAVALVEALIGKGYDVRVLDRHVAPEALVGTNRRFIEAELPHIASLLAGSPAALVAHADAIVLTSTGDDTAAVLALRPACPVLDLTRTAELGPATIDRETPCEPVLSSQS